METWRPATESAASLLHWGKIRQGENFVFSTYNYIFIGERAATLHFCFFYLLSPPPLVFPPLTSLFRTLLEQVDHWQSFLALVNMIMFCTGIPGHYPVNETVSSLTLTFWYTLQVRK